MFVITVKGAKPTRLICGYEEPAVNMARYLNQFMEVDLVSVRMEKDDRPNDEIERAERIVALVHDGVFDQSTRSIH